LPLQEFTRPSHLPSSSPSPLLTATSHVTIVEGGRNVTVLCETSHAERGTVRGHQHLQLLHVLTNQFGTRIVKAREHSTILEMCGKTLRADAFLSLIKSFGIIESARTSTVTSVSPFFIAVLRLTL
jgi:hypothetical protein